MTMMPMMNGTVPISEVAADAVVTTQATNGQDTLEEGVIIFEG
jgi:hypothetical protein